MGHYCYSCSEKLVGGIVSTRCDCIECFCQKCWDDLYKPKFKVVSKVVYCKNKDDTFSVLDKNLYRVLEKINVEKVECPECFTEWKQEDFDYY